MFRLRFLFLDNEIHFDILSFDWLFSSPDRMNKSIEMSQFVLYMMYVWLFSLILAIIVYTIDSYRHDAENGLKACLLDCKFTNFYYYYFDLLKLKRKFRVLSDKNSTECSYFYMPFWMIFAINQIFFTLTALKIQRTKQHHRDNTRQIMVLLMASRELDHNGINNEEKWVLKKKLNGNNKNWLEMNSPFSLFNSFALYLRLHIVICLTWVCKGLALFADEKLVIYSNVTYAVQGLVIFVLFVMNGHVLQLISQRYVWILFFSCRIFKLSFISKYF